ncbi:hypothetical protein D3C83_195000 [compost metagenome]
MLGVCLSASSAMAFNPMCLPARSEVFDVMRILQVESTMRPESASALKPPKTIE